MAEVVYTRDVSSGRIHKRYPTESGALATLEGCNLDDAGDYEVVDQSVVEAADHDSLCENDFPEAHE